MEEQIQVAEQPIADPSALTPPEAAAYLDLSEEEFRRQVKRFGVGRHNQALEGEQWVYGRADLDQLRQSLETERVTAGGSGRPTTA